jgi:Uma2 family endonuclease
LLRGPVGVERVRENLSRLRLMKRYNSRQTLAEQSLEGPGGDFVNILARPPRLTPEQFERLPDQRGLELIDGIVKEKGMGTESGSVNSLLHFYLNQLVIPGRLGRVIDSDGMYRCFPGHPNRIRKPDVSFIRQDRLPNGRVPIGIVLIRPDLAVEVLSPNDKCEELDEKIADYFDAQIPLIWVVSPRSRTVLVYHADGSAQRLRDTDDLTADPIVPGFRVRIADLFPNPPESSVSDESTPPAPSA